MRNGKLKKELQEANEALERGMFIRLGYAFLIDELIKQHPDAKATFNKFIKEHPAFKRAITDLADILELELVDDEE